MRGQRGFATRRSRGAGLAMSTIAPTVAPDPLAPLAQIGESIGSGLLLGRHHTNGRNSQ